MRSTIPVDFSMMIEKPANGAPKRPMEELLGEKVLNYARRAAA